jgi:hypothetical protein
LLFSLLFFPLPLIFIIVAFFLIKRGGRVSYRQRDPWGIKNVTDYYGKPKEEKKDPEHQIFELAFRNKGRVTLSEIILETGLSMKKAEKIVNSMVDNIRVCMEVNDNGLVYYEFPEIRNKFGKE